MKGRSSAKLSPSIVTWFSCIASSSAAWVFGEARLISSTSRTFANTGPGRNSNSFERWLKTLTPVTSEGSRSGVNWIREKGTSSERASDFASIVLPTPGKSSMITCPSAIRPRMQSRSVSAGAWTTRARLAARRSSVSADEASAAGSLRASTALLEQALDLVQDPGGARVLRCPRAPPVARLRQQRHLVLGRVEADAGSGHVVVDDEIEVLVCEHPPLALEPRLPHLGAEADENLAVALALAEPRKHVRRRLELEPPWFLGLRTLSLDRLGGTVVGHSGRHHQYVGAGGASPRLALHVGGGRRLDDLDTGRSGDGDVRREERHRGAAPPGLGGEGDAHPARRAVAEEADRVERLAGAAGADEHPGAGERTLCLIDTCSQQRLDPRGDGVRLAHPAEPDLALGELPRLGADQLDAAGAQDGHVRLRRLVLPHARVHRRGDQHRAAVRERRLGQHLVGEPVGELAERVRRQRRDHEQVGALEMRVWAGALGLAREREERLGPDEALRTCGRQRQDVVAGLDQQAHELAGLVGRDAAGDPEQDARHRRIVPAKRQLGGATYGPESRSEREAATFA